MLEFNTLGLFDLGYPNYLAQAAKKDRWGFVNALAYPDDSVFSPSTDLIVLSLLHGPINGYYRHKTTAKSVCYGFSCDDYSHSVLPSSATIAPNEWAKIRDELTFVGVMPISECIADFKVFFDALSPQTRVCIIMGPEMPSEFGECSPPLRKIDALTYYRELNQAMKKAFSANKNVFFIEPIHFYSPPKRQRQLFYRNSPSIAHYPRKTYYRIAKELQHMFGSRFQIDYGKIIRRRICKIIKACVAKPWRVSQRFIHK